MRRDSNAPLVVFIFPSLYLLPRAPFYLIPVTGHRAHALEGPPPSSPSSIGYIQVMHRKYNKQQSKAALTIIFIMVGLRAARARFPGFRFSRPQVRAPQMRAVCAREIAYVTSGQERAGENGRGKTGGCTPPSLTLFPSLSVSLTSLSLSLGISVSVAISRLACL